METNQTTTTTATVVKSKLPMKTILIVGVLILVVIIVFFIVKSLFFKTTTTSSGEITWWGLWEDEQTVNSIISDYQTKNPKVKIKFIRQSKEDYRERLINSLTKGTGPDIFRFHNSWVPMLSGQLDKMPSNIYSVTDFSNNFYPVAISDLTVGSNLVGIPLEYDGLSLYINQDLFEKSGKTIPTTWNELRQTARDLTIKDENDQITQAGVALGRTENVDHWPEILALMMLQNGVDLTKPTGKLAEDALDFYTIFSKEDGVWDATLPQSTVAFASGKLAMYFAPSWRSFEIKLQNPNLRFRTVSVPQLPKTQANEQDVNYASYWVEGVASKSKNKTAAWNFLKYLSSKEALMNMYNNASKIRMFGEPYSRKDMSQLLSGNPILESIANQANTAQSWYLQSKTWDGPTGINSQINKYFEDAINAVNSGKESKTALEPVQQGVVQVLSQYGIKIQ